ncbi:hypothetical protein BKA93DRAFT_775070 [Sparassis latifolia]
MTPPALLLSLSEPGPDVPEAEFHDWYNSDHIPARIASPVFQSWTRYTAIDGLKPSYMNIYDLESLEATKTPAYTNLPQNRSEAEKDLIKRVSWLEPRVYEEHHDDPFVAPSSLFNPIKPAEYALILTAELPPELEGEFMAWYTEELLPKVSKAPGWVRSRQFKLKDWKRLGVEGSKDKTVPPTYLAIHEFATAEFTELKETVQSDKTPRYEKLVQGRTSFQRRVVKFLKKFERV